MLILENIKLALNAIRINKMRSFLTMLGIIIGISSVIAITAIGSSMQGVVDKEFENFGKNAMFIYPNWAEIDEYIPDEMLMDRDDMEAIKERFKDEITYIDPSISLSSDTRVGRKTGKINAQGCAAGIDQVMKINMIHGRMINQADVDGAKNFLVLEATGAMELFGTEDAVGKVLPMTVEGELRDMTVVGVFKKEVTLFSGSNRTGNYEGYVPYSIMPSQADSTVYLNVYTAEGLDQQQIGEQIAAYAARVTGVNEKMFRFESAALQQGTINNMLGTMSMAIGIIAGISLLVGGIGIMNIMLVSVTERTREIGIRKSLGARTRDILMQFLIESMVVSAVGGLIGTGLGVSIAGIGMKIAKVDFAMNPMAVVVAVGFSAVVGVFFGIYPAKRAAKLDPIEALRFE